MQGRYGAQQGGLAPQGAVLRGPTGARWPSNRVLPQPGGEPGKRTPDQAAWNYSSRCSDWNRMLVISARALRPQPEGASSRTT